MLGQKQATSMHMLMMVRLIRTVFRRVSLKGSSRIASERSMKATSGYTVTTWRRKVSA